MQLRWYPLRFFYKFYNFGISGDPPRPAFLLK